MKSRRKFCSGGFKTFIEFVIASVPERADAIVEEYNRIIYSKQDREFFSNEMINPSNHNEALKNAAAKYKYIVNSL